MGRDGRRFVRNARDKSAGTSFSLVSAFRCAGQGLVYAFVTQRNMKIHAPVALVALALGAVLSLSVAEWAAIIICIALVFAFECMNTAVESVVDLVSPEYSELARHAKDCAAGAVFVCALAALVVGVVVFLPKAAALIGFG